MDHVYWSDFEEPSEGAERDGWVLKIVGWLMIIGALVPALWIDDSHRDGSNFWLWFGVIVGGIGLLSLVAGSFLRIFKGTRPLPWLERWIISDETRP
jgi:hypothetical protein